MHKALPVLSLLLACAAPALAATHETLLIAPGDLVHVQVVETPEMDAHARVTDDGSVPVIGIGTVKVSGLTPAEAADAIHDRLVSTHYLNHPQVSIIVEEYATQSVSVIGEVKTTGVYSISTARPVLDVLALAGGLDPEADRNIFIERQGDKDHPVVYFVSNKGEEAITSQVMVNPGDTLVVPRAGIVYILGEVNRPGGYVMSNNESKLSLLQGLAMAGGISRAAKQSKARLISRQPDGTLLDRTFSVGDLQEGKVPDFALKPGDVLYLPFSYAKNLATTGAASIVASTAGASIYAHP